ncbi:zinc finger BED domain-containing protein 1-like isoform X2 [Hippocampus comes]|uniref:zinc finger BED domain-containing protein 1-like isoform X2 n=1 Tax=Hippocampus comes TaxID=109280 RepID=UPI00094EB926|nr:PREDICTED: zinc finger BED domain-containing protein 1-like isoform X2 [Hippocampus comes]
MQESNDNPEQIKSDLSSKVKNKDPCVQLRDIQGKSPFCAKFARIECYGVDTNYVACRRCEVLVKYTSESGTSGLIRHRCQTPKAADEQCQPNAATPKRKCPAQGVFTRLAATIARMCSQDLRPLSFVEGRGFVAVAQELLEIGSRFGGKFPVEGILPSARTLSRHLDEAYEQLKGRVKDEIRQCQGHAATVDLWTGARTNTRFLTLTAHYIHEWKMVHRVLATREVAHAEHIKSTAEEILQEFGILSEDIVLVTDDGSDVVAAFQDYTRLSCASHNIDLILRHVFECLDEKNPLHGPVVKLMAATKALVTHLKREGLDDDLEQPLEQAAETRWNSKLAVLKSVNHALKSGELHEILHGRNELRFLDDVDAKLLDDVTLLLAPFDEATRHLSAGAPTLHLVLPTKVTLLKALLQHYHHDGPLVTELKVKLAQAVDSKFQIHLYHKVATALSPRLRTFLRKTVSAQEYEEVINTLAQLIQKSQAPEGLAVGAGPAETSEVDDFFAACIEEEEPEEKDEGWLTESWERQVVRQYMSDKVPLSHSLLDFWKNRSGVLLPVAKKFLSIPASATPSEQGFALADRRAALNPQNVDALLFLHSNSQV